MIESIKSKAINIIPYSKLNCDGKLLGEGGFGAVYRGKWINTDVAIKEMRISYSEFKTMDQEMTFMSTNRHPSIVTMYGVAITELRENKLQCCIIMELMQYDLDTYI